MTEGLPRPVSSEDALRFAALNEDCANAWLDSSEPHKFRMDTGSTIRTLVSERDALAGRVAELEAERDRWHQRARELLAAFGEPQPFTHQGMFDRPMTFGGCPFCGRKECVPGPPIQECYGDCPTDPATCPNPCTFNGRRALATPPSAATPEPSDAERYQLVRRGQHWSVIDGIGNVLRGDDLDAAIDAIRATKGGKL